MIENCTTNLMGNLTKASCALVMANWPPYAFSANEKKILIILTTLNGSLQNTENKSAELGLTIDFSKGAQAALLEFLQE